jgi:hypothetical protein
MLAEELHRDEPSVPEPTSFEVETATEKLKRYKSSGIDQIPGKLIKAGSNSYKLCSEIHEYINSVWNKKYLPQQWNESITAPTYKKDENLTVVIIEGYHCYQLHVNFFPISFSQSLTP